MRSYLMGKFIRFLLTIILGSVATAFILLSAVPHVGQVGIVAASVIIALFVAVFDFGLFSEEFEI